MAEVARRCEGPSPKSLEIWWRPSFYGGRLLRPLLRPGLIISSQYFWQNVSSIQGVLEKNTLLKFLKNKSIWYFRTSFDQFGPPCTTCNGLCMLSVAPLKQIQFWPVGPIIWTTLNNLLWIAHVKSCSTETNPYDILGPVLTNWTINLDHLAQLAIDCACLELLYWNATRHRQRVRRPHRALWVFSKCSGLPSP